MFSRRVRLLKSTSCGFGYLALAGPLWPAARRRLPKQREPACRRRQPHFAPRAKRVIFMFMQGGPSHVDTFDYKPPWQRTTAKPRLPATARATAS